MFAIICTRDSAIPPITHGLVDTLCSFGVEVKILANQSSIFEAYERGLEMCNADKNDIIIYCHDDLQILSDKSSFMSALAACVIKDTGIVGPAGTTLLGKDAIWWKQDRWAAGYHRGIVKHISENQPIQGMSNDQRMVTPTSYGPHGQVVALDGLFLAARKEIWDTIGLKKPKYFKGLWDFYDIHYTTTSHLAGFKNYAVNLDLIHHSNGELVGRDSWHQNREAFIAHTKLPLKL